MKTVKRIEIYEQKEINHTVRYNIMKNILLVFFVLIIPISFGTLFTMGISYDMWETVFLRIWVVSNLIIVFTITYIQILPKFREDFDEKGEREL